MAGHKVGFGVGAVVVHEGVVKELKALLLGAINVVNFTKSS